MRAHPFALLAVVAAAIAGYGLAEPRELSPAQLPRAASSLTPRQLAGQRIVCGFEGRTMPSGLAQAVAAGEIGGVILFKPRNISSRRQVGSLTRAIQGVQRPAGLQAALIVTADQEGGQVKRLPGPPKFSAAEMGERGAKVAKAQGAATGRSMRKMGFNVDLAPVLDVARRRGFIADQDRAFGSKPGRVGAIASAFTRGLQGARVAATAKHFPGLGSTSANTDLKPSRIPLKASKLRRVDEAPYRTFIGAGGKLVMVSTAHYPALDGGALPASSSRQITTDELRGRLGFQGVTISDSLETPAATAGAGPAEVALRSAAAGIDLLLYVHCDAGAKAAGVLANALSAGTLDRAAFEASVDRVLALRAGL